jgi:hypothetical protein
MPAGREVPARAGRAAAGLDLKESNSAVGQTLRSRTACDAFRLIRMFEGTSVELGRGNRNTATEGPVMPVSPRLVRTQPEPGSTGAVGAIRCE